MVVKYLYIYVDDRALLTGKGPRSSCLLEETGEPLLTGLLIEVTIIDCGRANPLGETAAGRCCVCVCVCVCDSE